MATDLAIDYSTGDLLIGPDNGLELRIGRQTVEQRIRVRLRVIQGEWHLDPTDGQLGSNLREILRLPQFRAEQEVGLTVREALAPMEDIKVEDVQVTQDPKDPRQMNIVISYFAIEPTGDVGTDAATTTLSVVA